MPADPTTAERHCLYADVADGTCALRATADSPPPTRVQWRVLLAENAALREQVERLRDELCPACNDYFATTLTEDQP